MDVHSLNPPHLRMSNANVACVRGIMPQVGEVGKRILAAREGSVLPALLTEGIASLEGPAVYVIQVGNNAQGTEPSQMAKDPESTRTTPPSTSSPSSTCL